MKKQIQRKTEKELILKYPIYDKLKGWFFRTQELSANCWIVEGTDRFGRMVHREGIDPDLLLQKCVEDAKDILGKLRIK